MSCGCFQCWHSNCLPLYGSPPPHLHPYRSACGIGYASIKIYKMAGNSASYPFNSQCMDRHRIMVSCMQASVFLPKIQCFTSLKLLFLNIYNCAWKPSFLKSRHTFIMHISGWFLALLRVCVGLQFIVHKLFTLTTHVCVCVYVRTYVRVYMCACVCAHKMLKSRPFWIELAYDAIDGITCSNAYIALEDNGISQWGPLRELFYLTIFISHH